MPVVIKAGDVAAIRAKVTPIGLVDHVAEARAALEHARAQAADLFARAEKQAKEESHREFARARELGHKTGYKKGYEEGKEIGRDDARRESLEHFEQANAQNVQHMLRAVDAMDQIVTHLETARRDLQHSAEQHLLDFAVRFASKLTHAIGAIDHKTVEANLQRCITLVQSRTDLKIRVNPRDLEHINNHAPGVVERALAAKVLEITADDSIAAGGCVVETANSIIDASLETQIEEMVALVAGTESRDA